MQNRFARMFPGLESICYKEVWNKLGLFSGASEAEVYKIMRGLDKVDSLNVFFQVGNVRY